MVGYLPSKYAFLISPTTKCNNAILKLDVSWNWVFLVLLLKLLHVLYIIYYMFNFVQDW